MSLQEGSCLEVPRNCQPLNLRPIGVLTPSGFLGKIYSTRNRVFCHKISLIRVPVQFPSNKFWTVAQLPSFYGKKSWMVLRFKHKIFWQHGFVSKYGKKPKSNGRSDHHFPSNTNNLRVKSPLQTEPYINHNALL
jgi:hypothetical protein